MVGKKVITGLTCEEKIAYYENKRIVTLKELKKKYKERKKKLNDDIDHKISNLEKYHTDEVIKERKNKAIKKYQKSEKYKAYKRSYAKIYRLRKKDTLEKEDE